MKTQYPIQRKLEAKVSRRYTSRSFHIGAPKSTPGGTPLAPSSIGYPANRVLKRSICEECLYFLTIKVQNDGERYDHGRAAPINGGEELQSSARDGLRGDQLFAKPIAQPKY